jgi:hypothetical protein
MNRHHALRGIYLDLIYLVPDEGPADERYFHDDIVAMSELDRRRDWERARLRLLLDPKPHSWLIRRCDLLRGSFNNDDK